MKKSIATILTLVMLLSLAACGKQGSGTSESGTNPSAQSSGNYNQEILDLEKKYTGLMQDTLKWEYDASTKTITISGEGPMREYRGEAPEWDQYNSEAENIVIGDNITSVGAYAFCSFSAIKNVKIADSVEFIGDSAFDYCTALWTVNFPQNLKYVGERAFYNDLLHSDTGFVFPEGMIYIGNEAFHSAFKESYVSIPASLTTIETTAFDNMFVDEFRVDAANTAYSSDNGILYDKNMTTVINYPAGKTDAVYEVPGSVTTILSDAIEVTNTLEKIVIPAGVTKIEEGAIFWNYALSAIEVAADNKNYMSPDGVLYTKDGKTLLSYPIADARTEYTILEGCEKIGAYAMSQASNLAVANINEGLTEIGDYGFYCCQNLQQMGLPKSLKKIGVYGLGACDALNQINYSGSADSWQKIEIDEYNERLSSGGIPISYAE